MNYFGVYHSDYSRTGSARFGGGFCDAPCMTKGHMSLCARDVATKGDVIAMARGRVRNRAALASQLGLEPDAGASQVVLAAYQKWGEDYPARVEGPAATCVMDSAADRLVLSRDRMGEQPVFYALKPGSAAFADHPDSLLRSMSVEPVADADCLRELFGLGPARSPGRTFYRDMRMLEPGCALVICENRARVDRYFRIEDAPHEEGEKATVERVRALLEAAVSEIAGLKPAVMLSGGLDSTALTALLRRRMDVVRSFSVDYMDNDRDFHPTDFRPEADAPYVRLAVGALGTQHRFVTLDAPGLLRGLGRAMSLRGFPGMADIDVSLMLLSQEIARFDGAVVSGECGDEVFGGYPWFATDAPLEGFPWSGSLKLREKLLRPEIREELKLTEYVRDTFEAHRREADPGADYAPGERRLRTMQRLCFQYFMPNLQERAVRMCAGAGIDVLTPLCDDRLVEYVYNVPWEMKRMGGQEKGLFRAAVSDLLPEKLLRRKKSPYPKTCSPQFAELTRQLTARLLSEGEAPIFDLIDRAAVEAIAQSDLNPADTPWFGQLMAGPQLLGYLWQVNRWLTERSVTIRL